MKTMKCLMLTAYILLFFVACSDMISEGLDTNAAVQLFPADTPYFSPPSGMYESLTTVVITAPTDGSAILYTDDGSDPTPYNGETYTGPFIVKKSTSFKAISVKDGFINSGISTADYSISISDPVFSPDGGSFDSSISVKLSCATEGALIRYTTNGDNPSSTEGTQYTAPFAVSSNTTVKAIAYLEGCEDSAIISRDMHFKTWSILSGPGSGGSIAAGTQVTDTKVDAVMVDGEMIPYVIYRDGANGGKLFIKKHVNGSWESVPPAGEAVSAGAAGYPSMKVNLENGTPVPYVAFQDQTQGNRVTVRRFSGGAWETIPAAGEGFSAGGASYISLSIVNVYDQPQVYVGYQDGGYGNRATVMKFTGMSWEPLEYEGFSDDEAYYTSLSSCIGDDGEPLVFIAYVDTAHRNNAGTSGLISVKKFNYSVWESVGVEGFSHSTSDYSIQGLSLYVFSNGTTVTPYVGFVGANGYYKIMRFDVTTWSIIGNTINTQSELYSDLFIYNSDGLPFPYFISAYGNDQNVDVWRWSGSSGILFGNNMSSPIYSHWSPPSIVVVNNNGLSNVVIGYTSRQNSNTYGYVKKWE